MSATNSTTNYNLPVFIGTDKPAWLTDWNGAMNTIDSTIASVSNAQQGDATTISGLQSSVSSLSDTVGGHTTAITSLNTAVTGNTGSINTINSLIGNGEPTTTDKTIIGAINELDADIQALVPISELTASNIPISSIAGVTADDVQEALEAINAKIPSAQGEGTVGTAIDLSSHTTEVGAYETTTDGYVMLYTYGGDNSYISTQFNSTFLYANQASNMVDVKSCYVKKGVKLWCSLGSNSQAKFFPYNYS